MARGHQQGGGRVFWGNNLWSSFEFTDLRGAWLVVAVQGTLALQFAWGRERVYFMYHPHFLHRFHDSKKLLATDGNSFILSFARTLLSPRTHCS